MFKARFCPLRFPKISSCSDALEKLNQRVGKGAGSRAGITQAPSRKIFLLIKLNNNNKKNLFPFLLINQERFPDGNAEEGPAQGRSSFQRFSSEFSLIPHE